MLPLSHSIKLLRVHDPEKELEKALKRIELLEKTIVGLKGAYTREQNDNYRLRGELAKERDKNKTSPAIPGVNK